MQVVRFKYVGETSEGYVYEYKGFQMRDRIILEKAMINRTHGGKAPAYLDVPLTYVMDDKGRVIAD